MNILKRSEAKRAIPMVMIKVDGIRGRAGYGGKVIVAHHMIVGDDFACRKIEKEGNCAGVIGTDAQVHVSLAAWGPFWKFLAVSEFAIQNIGGASPYVKVGVVMPRKCGFGEGRHGL